MALEQNQVLVSNPPLRAADEILIGIKYSSYSRCLNAIQNLKFYSLIVGNAILGNNICALYIYRRLIPFQVRQKDAAPEVQKITFLKISNYICFSNLNMLFNGKIRLLLKCYSAKKICVLDLS